MQNHGILIFYKLLLHKIPAGRHLLTLGNTIRHFHGRRLII